MSKKKAEVQYGVIESGKPMPTGRPMKYPWDKMKPGDRVRIPISAYSTAAKKYADRHGIKAKFAARTIDGACYLYRVS